MEKNNSPKRVTAIGGIFFKSENPEKMRQWYAEHLGLNTDKHGTTFEWRHSDAPEQKGFTAWSLFSEKTDYFKPSEKEFMVNYRVENLEWLLEQLKTEGVDIVGEIMVETYGKFAHILDPEGNKIELWESNDAVFETILDVVTK
jgi:predicted enzyme related to lactoylglutathione lyase